MRKIEWIGGKMLASLCSQLKEGNVCDPVLITVTGIIIKSRWKCTLISLTHSFINHHEKALV